MKMKKSYENIIYGKTLQEIRKKNLLTQEQVSQLTGLEPKYISQIECGITKGTISTMLKFCRAYGVTPNDILYRFFDHSEPSFETKKITKHLSKLNKRDKKIVLSLIDTLLES